jgi:hypothetical protein
VSLSIKIKNISDLTGKKELAIDTTFDPPWFSSDSTFKSAA